MRTFVRNNSLALFFGLIFDRPEGYGGSAG